MIDDDIDISEICCRRTRQDHARRSEGEFMKNEALELHKTPCNKCDADGWNYMPSIHALLRQWREELGITGRAVAAHLKCDASELSRFEKGKVYFGQQRIRKYIRFLEGFESKCSECRNRTSNKNNVCDECLDAMDKDDEEAFLWLKEFPEVK